MSKNMKWTLGLLVVGCMLAMAAPAGAEVIQQTNWDGWWMYEMEIDDGLGGMTDVKPSETDLDGNGTVDFTEGGSGSASVLDGVLTMSASLGDSIYYNSTGANELWPYQGFSYADGYTFEVRCQVVSSEGRRGPFTCYPSPADSGAHAFVSIAGSEVVWGAGSSGDPPYISLDTQNNTDGYHIFRVAQEPGASVYSVWRDGVLLRNDLGSGYNNSSVNRMLFGDCGGANGGEVRIDYFRFTEGAYAPIPEPSTLMLLAGGLLSLLVWRRR